MLLQAESFLFISFRRVVLAVLLAAAAGTAPRPALAQNPGASSDEGEASSARALVHVLDYMAADYEVAVAGGEIINELEYQEMLNFSASAASLLQDLVTAGVVPPASPLPGRVDSLQAGVLAKDTPENIAALARSIRTDVISQSGLTVAPQRWPDLANGQQLYQQACTTCHGAQGAGDGPLAAGLDPQPTNFVEGDRVASISPFQAYNTIRMGVDGTSMAAYGQLSDQEIWDLAFYVKSLQVAALHPEAAAGSEASGDVKQAVTLHEVATLSDFDLAAELERQGIAEPGPAMASLRMAGPDILGSSTLDRAVQLLEEARASYQRGETGQARQQAIMAYLEGVEPAEPSLTATDRSLTVLLEQRMMNVRSAIEGEQSPNEVSAAVVLALSAIDDARAALDQGDRSAWFAFLVAASILLREGLEAFLIILAILGVIRAVGDRKAARWVHAGWLAALGLGIAGWFFSDQLIRMGAAQRELMEGGIALLAVGVLLYVGFWLHSKTEIDKWKEFIDVRVKNVLQGGNLLGLAAISFFAVFREAFESVLFLSALTLEAGPQSKTAIAAGALLAIAAVLVLAAVTLRYSARLPIRSLFKYSSFIMGVLAVVLAGKGLHAIQEAGLLSITIAPVSFRFDLFGIYPTVETLAAQAFIVMLVVVLWTVPGRLVPRPA